MSSRLLALRQRRGELLARIASQREQVAEIGLRLQTPLAFADGGLAVVRFLRSHPVLVGGVTAVLVIRRRGVIGAAKVIWRLWKRYSQAATIAARLSQLFN
jgi:hypothetical protein